MALSGTVTAQRGDPTDERLSPAISGERWSSLDWGPDDRQLREVTLELPPHAVGAADIRRHALVGLEGDDVEGRLDGSEVRRYQLPAGSWIYQALLRPTGICCWPAATRPCLRTRTARQDPQNHGGKETPSDWAWLTSQD